MQKKQTTVIEQELVDFYENKLQDFHFADDENWAIYGTGKGAEIVFQILKKWKRLLGQSLTMIRSLNRRYIFISSEW